MLGKFTHRPSPAMAVALLALFVALGGTGYAAGRLSENGGSHARVAKKRKHKHKSVLVRCAARNVTCPAGPRGNTGPQGGSGANGTSGLPGTPAVFNRTRLDFSTSDDFTTSTTYALMTTMGTVTKQQSSSALRITVLDTVASATAGNHCIFQIRVDGNNDKGASATTEAGGRSGTDTINRLTLGSPVTMVAVFGGLGTGSHTISIYGRSVDGTDCQENVGNFAVRSALVEETM